MRKKLLLLAAGLSCIILFVAVATSKTGFPAQGEDNLLISRASLKNNTIALPAADFTLGQSFVVGISGKTLDEETKKLLQKIKPAGIVLYARNYENREQFSKLIAELQEFAKTTTGYHYFIMIDEEPGGATRLNLFKNVFASGFPDWGRIEDDIKEMAAVGINVDLAPLADFPFNEDTFIRKRVQAHTPEALTYFNSKFIALLQENHISATVKHFPGMGVFVDDPHRKLPHVSTDEGVLEESMNIFREGINSGTRFVMTGHAVYDDIDPGIPVTLSKKITTGILRNELGFTGLIITDDLSDMPFIVGRNINLAEATTESLKAGHSLVMFSHNPGKTLAVFDKLLQRFQEDQELKLVVEQNYRDVISFKMTEANVNPAIR